MMIRITCQHCGDSISTSTDRFVVRCPGCGRAVDVGTARQLRSLERRLAEIGHWGDFPRDLAEEIRGLIEERRDALRSRGPAKPPPLPVAPVVEKVEPKEDQPTIPVEESPPPGPAAPPSEEAATEAEPAPGEPRKPSVWARLGPAFTENILFALAAFLLVAGAVYFVTTAWTTMTGEQRLLVVVGGVELLGVVLFLAGKLLNRGGGLPEVERVLLLVVGFLVPIGAAAAGELIRTSPWVGTAAAAAVLAPGFLAARALARVADDALRPGMPVALTTLAILVLLSPTGGSSPASAGAAGALALLLTTRNLLRSSVPRLGPSLGPVLWSGLLLAFAAAVFAGAASLAAAREGWSAGGAVAPLGTVAAGMAAAAVLLEGSLARAGRLEGSRSAPLLVAGFALAVTGAVLAFGNERALLVAAALGAAAWIAAALRLPVPALLIPGLALAGIAYLKIGAPVRELALQVRDRAAVALGYEPKALPLAWYGVTFVPFVAACGLFSAWLRAKAREGHARAALGFTLAAAAGLCLLAVLLCRGDLRAPAGVLAAEGALLVLLSHFLRSRVCVLSGTALVFAGLSFGLHHLEVGSAVHVLAMSLAGLSAAAISVLVRARGTDFARSAASAFLDATAVLAGILAAVVAIGLLYAAARLPEGPRIDAASGLDAVAFPALAALLLVLAYAYRRPEPGLFGTLALARAATGILAAIGVRTTGPWLPFALAAAGAVLLPLLTWRPRPGDRLRRPGLPEADPLLLLPAGMAALAAMGALAVLGDLPHGPVLLHAGGLLASAAVLASAALLARQAWAGAGAGILVLAAGPLVAAVLGEGSIDLTHATGALGLAVAAAVVRAAALASSLRERTRVVLAPALGGVVIGAVSALLIWLLALLPNPAYRDGLPAEGVPLAAAALVGALAGRITRDERSASLAGLLLGFVAVGLVDAAGGREDLYAIGLLVASAVTALWSARNRQVAAPAVVHLAAALVLATVFCALDVGEPAVHLAAFGLIAVLGRLVAEKLPTPGGILLLVGTLLGIALALCARILDIPFAWQPTILLGFAAAAFLAPRRPDLGVNRPAAWALGIPLLVLGFAAAILHSIWVLGKEPSTAGIPTRDLVAGGTAALALLAASVGLALDLKDRLHRVLVPAAALLLGLFRVAPVNILVEGGYARFWRPDVEAALVGVLLALVVPGGRRKRSSAPYAFAGIGILLTVLEVRHLSTPLAFLAATLVPLVLLYRDRRAVHADLHGYGLIATAFAFVLYAVPKTGRPAPEVLTTLSATAAVLLVVLLLVARWFRGRPEGEWPPEAAGRFTRAAATAAVLAIACAVANTIAMSHRPAEADLTALVTFAMAVVAATSFRAASRPGRPALVHAAVAALLALYAFLAVRTGILDLLDGYHVHALAVIAVGLFAAAGAGSGRFARHLAADGLLLPLPAALLGILGIADAIWSPGRAASGLFLAAAAYGVGAVRLERAWLGGASVALVNLALFAYWRHRGIVDPAFYGVPPGVTLLVAGEVLRSRISPLARLQLFLAGVLLLYGSVGVQVLRVEEPTHALVLFGIGLATVVLGFLRDRNEWLVAGTSIVVLDVVAYLARHGFEESFLGAVLLVLAGLTVLAVGTLAALRRRRRSEEEETP